MPATLLVVRGLLRVYMSSPEGATGDGPAHAHVHRETVHGEVQAGCRHPVTDADHLMAAGFGGRQQPAQRLGDRRITDAADVRELALAACTVTDQAARAEIEASFAAAW